VIHQAVGGTDQDLVIFTGSGATAAVAKLTDLEAQLTRHAGRPLVIGSFSAASNVTGILTDADRVAALLHRHGALSVWDYSAAAPYVAIRVAESRPGGPRPQGRGRLLTPQAHRRSPDPGGSGRPP
jgi:cysteine sulfinate desulfinase/cysteine desulfurase-like protein